MTNLDSILKGRDITLPKEVCLQGYGFSIHPYGRKGRRTKEPLDESGREECKKISLKLNIQKTKIMASGPITSLQTEGKEETVTDFIFRGSKITVDGDCSQEIKRHLLLGRKATTNLESILKSRDITLPTKVHLVKAI